MGNIVLKITALIFGIALWFLVISQKDFQLTMEVPLTYAKLPENMAIANKPPHAIQITVEGRSWDLIRMQQQINKNPNAVTMIIDMQKSELGSSRIHLDEKNFNAPNFPDIRFVEPENQLLFVDIDVDTRITRNIPLKSNAQFNATQGYILADDPKISPEELTVSGARNALARIIDIHTDSVYFDSLFKSEEFNVPLDFSTLPPFVNPSDSVIKVAVNIQKMSTKEFKDLPVSLIGIFDKEKYTLVPNTVSVELTGGEIALDSIEKSSIELVLEFNRFAIEDVDSLPPTVKLALPANINREKAIKAIQVKPEKVRLQQKVEKNEVPSEDTEE